MELLKFTTKLLMIGCLLAVFTGCESEREERKEERMENGQMENGGGMQEGGGTTTPDGGMEGTDMMGCCQKADNTCSAPVSEQQCTGMGGQFNQGADCGTDGMCAQGGMQPQQ